MATRLVERLWLALLVGAVAVAANVEKTIFVASQGATGAASGLGIDSLPRLTPDRNAWRTDLPAVFPWSESFPANGTTWVLLDELNEGQRYELRVCWAATQPTAFSVDVFDFVAVSTTPELAASLATFVERNGVDAKTALSSSSSSVSTSLLRIVAAADFVAADRSAMQPDRVSSVLTDIILDPYLLNVLPRSLVPIVAAILAVASVSAWLARRVILPGVLAVAAEWHKDAAKAARGPQKKTH
ncbi:hypothetical protein SEUCBS139899_004672 [Sporothrix eucalyptigena]|uniref:Uncharacterized protein n=1 Tax=Sporothrix eucalyptigena TaxID=1812306 RepID=A0ABP0C6Q7_9PEZI